MHAAAANIAPHSPAGAGELVDLVDINDAIFGEGDVAIGFRYEFTHEVIDIAADVAGFGELGGIGFNKRHSNEFRDVLDEVGFAHSGGTDDHDVLFLDFEGLRVVVLRFERLYVIVVITDRDRQGLLGIVLTNDEAIEVRFDVAGEVVELENIVLFCHFGFEGIFLFLG